MPGTSMRGKLFPEGTRHRASEPRWALQFPPDTPSSALCQCLICGNPVHSKSYHVQLSNWTPSMIPFLSSLQVCHGALLPARVLGRGRRRRVCRQHWCASLGPSALCMQ